MTSKSRIKNNLSLASNQLKYSNNFNIITPEDDNNKVSTHNIS